MNRTCTGDAGNRNLIPVGKCNKLLPLCIIHDLPADLRLWIEVALPSPIANTVRCPDTDPARLVMLRWAPLLLVRGCNGPWLTLMYLFGPMSTWLILPTPIAYLSIAIVPSDISPDYIMRYRATPHWSPVDHRV